MRHRFERRIFSAGAFLRDLGFLLIAAPRVIGALRNREVGTVFMEKIMAVTTAVNGCRYCSWFHARRAVSSGMSQEEVRRLLSLQFHTDATDFELPALLFAQHYAETNRNPDREMQARLLAHYGERTAGHILLFIRMIFFGNLAGNTWDAVLSRFQGYPAQNGNILFELLFFLVTAPFMVPTMIMSRRWRHPARVAQTDRSPSRRDPP